MVELLSWLAPVTRAISSDNADWNATHKVQVIIDTANVLAHFARQAISYANAVLFDVGGEKANKF